MSSNAGTNHRGADDADNPGLKTEVHLAVDDGMPAACALHFDHVSPAQRSRMGAVLCHPIEELCDEVRDALLMAYAFQLDG